MAIQKTEAIVLRTQPFRSSSLIVTFFTKDFGKVRGLAKGVREERQTRASLFELFTRLEIIYYEKTRSDLHLISEAAILETGESLRARLDTIAYASYFAELTDRLCEVHDPHLKTFDLLSLTYRYLPSLPGARLGRLFEVKLLNEIGWLPYLEGCLHCSRRAIEQGYFSARQGALYCDRCAREAPDAQPLGRGALAIMRFYISHDLEEALKLSVKETDQAELDTLMKRFFMDRLNRPLKSQIFMESVAKSLRISPKKVTV